LEEEFRRLLVSLEYKAGVWEKRVIGIPVGKVDVQEAQGATAYGLRQAAMYRDMAARVKQMWEEEKLARGKKRVRAWLASGGPPGDCIDKDEEEATREQEEEEEEEDLLRSDVASDDEEFLQPIPNVMRMSIFFSCISQFGNPKGAPARAS
jgi:hypothetical protein